MYGKEPKYGRHSKTYWEVSGNSDGKLRMWYDSKLDCHRLWKACRTKRQAFKLVNALDVGAMIRRVVIWYQHKRHRGGDSVTRFYSEWEKMK